MKPYELFGDGGYQEGMRAQRRLDIEKRRELRDERQAYIQEIILLKEQRRNTRDRDEKAVLTQQINEAKAILTNLPKPSMSLPMKSMRLLAGNNT